MTSILLNIAAENNFSTKARQKTDQILNGKNFKVQHLGFIQSFLNFINRIYNDTLGKVFKLMGHLVDNIFSASQHVFGSNGPLLAILVIATVIGVLIYLAIIRRQHIASQKHELATEYDFEKIDDIGKLTKMLAEAKSAGDFNLSARINFRISLIKLENAQILLRYENRTLGQINHQLNDFDFFKLTSTIESIVYFTYSLNEADYNEFFQKLENTTSRIIKTTKPPDPLESITQIESLIS